MSDWIAGADGCRGGWIIVLMRLDGTAAQARLTAGFAALLALPEQPRALAIDVPIGLPKIAIKGGRLCCNLVRARLGARKSSVFSAPARATLAAQSYREACALNLENSDPPRKIAKQTYNIMDRIREVDALMTPDVQSRVFECHPEFAFTIMNGERALELPKKVKNRPYSDGMALRRQLLARAGITPPDLPAPREGIRAAEDDLLDACACAFAARRIAGGEAIRLPAEPPTDERGLRMEIVA